MVFFIALLVRAAIILAGPPVAATVGVAILLKTPFMRTRVRNPSAVTWLFLVVAIVAWLILIWLRPDWRQDWGTE